jgi:hypothetical protein
MLLWPHRLGFPRMLRSCSRVISLIAIVACLSMTAQAADTTLTLACKGTADMTGIGDTGPVSMGLVVNLTTRTVHGFREQFTNSEAQLTITEVKETIFVLRGQFGPFVDRPIMDLSGVMDRMTGDVTVTATQRPPVEFTKTYSLKCRPTQRMF